MAAEETRAEGGRATHGKDRQPLTSSLQAVMDRPLPQSYEAERAILGSVLINRGALDRAASFIGAGDFYNDSNALIFAEMQKAAFDGAEIDPLTLKARLEALGKLSQVGGAAYIASLVDHIPDIANVEHYAKLVKEKALLRSLVRAGSSIALSALSPAGEPVEGLIGKAEAMIEAVGARGASKGPQAALQSAGAHSMASSTMKRFEARLEAPGAITGIDMGYESLNLYVYGYQRGTVMLIAGRSSVGKTTVGWNLAHAALEASSSTRVAYFSLEMTLPMFEDRILSMMSGVASAVIKTGISSREQIRLVGEAGAKLASYEGRLFGNANPMSIRQIIKEIRRLHKKAALDIAFIDYIQLIESDEPSPSREQEVSRISKRLVRLAKELDIAVVAFAQLNRSALSRDDRPTADIALRESDALFHDARSIIMLDIPRLRDAGNLDKKECELNLYFDKNSEGPRGQVRMHFDGQRFRVEEGECRPGCRNFRQDTAAAPQARLVA